MYLLWINVTRVLKLVAPIIEGFSFYGREYESSYVLPAKIHSFTMNFKKSSTSEHLKSKWQKIEKLIQVKYIFLRSVCFWERFFLEFHYSIGLWLLVFCVTLFPTFSQSVALNFSKSREISQHFVHKQNFIDNSTILRDFPLFWDH